VNRDDSIDMTHISDDDLILHFYGENAGGEARIDAHLQTCASCQDAWHDLQETLQLVDSAVPPDPEAGFERVMWAKVQAALPPPPSTGRWFRLRWLAPVAMGAAAIAVAVAIGYQGRPAIAPSDRDAVVLPAKPPARPGSEDRARERVLLTALNEHFDQTQLLLVELMNAPADGAMEMAFERATADELVTSSRLYRVTAEQTGHPQLAQMLEELESVLVEIARSPERVNRTQLQTLRARIDDEDLLFKVRAVSTAIHGRQKDLMSADE
jgi:hypothetical protein